jgi:CheY-like chemotaxis protein
MTIQPKRPSGSYVNPTVARPATPGLPSARPANVRDAKAEAHALGGGAVARPSAIASTSGRKSILIVDPDASVRARLRALLEEYYDVIEANDGMEAVELSSKIQPPAMVVSDTAMPRVDGFTLAKIFRNNPLMKRVPIMFVSAQHSPQHVTQALVIGVTQYLPKTTPIAQVAEKIRKIVM